jgi:cytochrome c-type biogenesis protein CcmH
MKRFAIYLALCVIYAPMAVGQISDAELEARAKNIGQSLRCVVCQNQSIEESDVSLAEDMRRLVRSRVRAGESDQQVLDFMQQRYGDFVLLKPPVQKNTYVLWGAPALALLLGAIWFFRAARRRADISVPEALSAAEREKLDKILSGLEP